MKSTIYEPGSEPACLPGLLKQNHKKALRFSTNKSQQLRLLSLKYANYRLTFVNKPLPPLPQLPGSLGLAHRVRDPASRRSLGIPGPLGKGRPPSLAPLVWILSRHPSARFFAPQNLALGLSLGPPTFSLSLGARHPQQLSTTSSWVVKLCLVPGSPRSFGPSHPLDASFPGPGSPWGAHSPYHLPARWRENSEDAGCRPSHWRGPVGPPPVPNLTLVL